jgi:hypothetical protein
VVGIGVVVDIIIGGRPVHSRGDELAGQVVGAALGGAPVVGTLCQYYPPSASAEQS